MEVLVGKPWENAGKVWEIIGRYAKTMGKYKNIMGKPQENIRTLNGTNYGKTMGNIMGNIMGECGKIIYKYGISSMVNVCQDPTCSHHPPNYWGCDVI